jgi:hypothetical protein
MKHTLTPFAHFALWLTIASCQFQFLMAQTSLESTSPYSQWKQGPPTAPNFFPIAVWLQSPRNAERYKAIGINTFVGLWKGPTEAQLSELKKAGMKVICHQNEVGLNSPNSDIIIAWMHGDEPDNAQPKAGGGYGPPISPEKITADYEELKKSDTSRPIFLNLGQGVAYDQYIGRGVRTNHPEDYREYIQGSDIASFDIYPAVHDKPEVKGKLEFVPKGVLRLREWSEDKKIVWNCIEASRISNTKVKPTVEQIRSEVWMSLIAGSRGIIYFVHQFEPRFSEASLLEDEELLNGIATVNQQIQQLAPVLNSPSIKEQVKLEVDSQKVLWMCKEFQGELYLFLANQTAKPISVAVEFEKTYRDANVTERLEEKSSQLNGSKLTADLNQYGVAIFQVSPK